jgi:hypothetical protein
MAGCYTQVLQASCGAGLIHSFTPEVAYGRVIANGSYMPGGAGLHCAAYVSSKVCKDVYEAQKAKWKIAYQSTKRRNNNSNRQFMFVVYDRTIKPYEDMNKDFKFPFRPRSNY